MSPRDKINSVFKLWKTLNPITNPSKTTARTVINKLVYEGYRITNKQEISDTMNKNFCDIGVRLHSELWNYGNRFLDYLPPRTNDSFNIASTCQDGVLFETTKMKSMKAPGLFLCQHISGTSESESVLGQHSLNLPRGRCSNWWCPGCDMFWTED